MEVALGLIIICALVAAALTAMFLIGARPDIAITVALIIGVVAIIWTIAT